MCSEPHLNSHNNEITIDFQFSESIYWLIRGLILRELITIVEPKVSVVNVAL